MNLTKSKTDCPKAFEKLVVFLQDYPVVFPGEEIGIYHLIECFFDSVGIYIFPHRDFYGFYCTIDKFEKGENERFANRTEALEEAIPKAFEIYEAQLNA